MPPSPRLSARITRARYLIEMMMMRAHSAIDAMPSALVSTTARCWCSNASRNAYSGLVPMSPNTTPSAPNARAPVPTADPRRRGLLRRSSAGHGSHRFAGVKNRVILLLLLTLVGGSCGGSDGGAQRTVFVDFTSDEFASSLFLNAPTKLAVKPGTTIVFRKTWTGEPHTVTGGTLANDALQDGKVWLDFFQAFDALAGAGVKLPDPENPGTRRGPTSSPRSWPRHKLSLATASSRPTGRC